MRAEKNKDRTVLDGVKEGHGVCLNVRSETASKLLNLSYFRSSLIMKALK